MRALRFLTAVLLSLIGLAAIYFSVGATYSLSQEYGLEGLAGPIVAGLVGGSIAAVCCLGVLHLLGRGRRILPTGALIVGLVVAATVVGGWLGLRSHEQGLEASASACDEPVGSALEALGPTLGTVAASSDEQGGVVVNPVFGDRDGSCRMWVGTTSSVPTSVPPAALALGWSEEGNGVWVHESGVRVTMTSFGDVKEPGGPEEVRLTASLDR